MTKHVDKAALLLLCTAALLLYKTDLYAVVPVLCAVLLSAIITYLDRDRVTEALFLAIGIASIFFPPLVFFLPLLCYDVYHTGRAALALAGFLPLGMAVGVIPVEYVIAIPLLAGLGYLLKVKTAAYEKLRGEHIRLQDTERDHSLQLERQNQELLERQDYEIRLATLAERNRIARDIHDSVGHVLTGAILQTGALLALSRDAAERERLGTLRDTLTQGMDSIRSSIHGLYDESVDLYAEAKALTDSFRFCDIALDYDIDENPDREIRFALLAILKEALANVMKHSNATRVTVTFREHPALYQLVIRDNGKREEKSGEGIGLSNMERRVSALGGIFNAGFRDGFTVFVSIPKGETA